MDMAPPIPPPEQPTAVMTVWVAAADPYTAPVIQVWHTVRQDQNAPITSEESAPPADTATDRCARHSLPAATPNAAPPVQVWYTVTPRTAGNVTPCGSSIPAGAPKGLVGELSGRAYKLNIINRRRLAPAIQQIAQTYHLEPALLHAVISAESGYNPQARSPKNARGLMQLMPDTARRFGVTDPDEPTANLHGGARYLRWLLDLFPDLRLALAGYNAGENAVIRYGNTVPPYPETRTYVRRVLEYYRQYRRTPFY